MGRFQMTPDNQGAWAGGPAGFGWGLIYLSLSSVATEDAHVNS